MRWTAVVACVLVLACTDNPMEPPAAPKWPDQPTVVWEDGPDGTSARYALVDGQLIRNDGEFRLEGDYHYPARADGPWITVLCKFADVSSEPHARSWYETVTGPAYPGDVHFWRDASFGALAGLEQGGVYGWYTLPHPESYYNPNLNALKDDCGGFVDPFVDFNHVVGLTMIVNAYWGSAWGGSAWVTWDQPGKFVAARWLPSWAGAATYAHEMGHGIGFGHSGYNGGAYSNYWDVMSYGRTSDPAWITVPSGTIAYHKDVLSWLDAAYAVPSGESTVRLHRLTEPAPAGSYSSAEIPVDADRLYTIEARLAHGYDVNAPGEAVVVHYVDRTRPDGQYAQLQAALGVGESATFGGVNVQVQSQDAAGFTVTFGGTVDPPPPPDPPDDPTDPPPDDGGKGPKACKKKGRWAC